MTIDSLQNKKETLSTLFWDICQDIDECLLENERLKDELELSKAANISLANELDELKLRINSLEK